MRLMKSMQIIVLSLLLSLVLIPSLQAQEKKQRVATVTPICQSMASALLQNTPVEVLYLPPKKLPLTRIANWLNKHRNTQQPAVDALVSISAVRPEWNYFPSLRRTNIRTVNIDIAEAIFPGGERVVVADSKEKFWLNTNNALIMLGILKRDLSQLWPELASKVDNNYQKISAHLRASNLSIDALLAEKDIAIVHIKDASYAAFAASLAVDIMPVEQAADLGLSGIQIGSKKRLCPDSSKPCWLIDDFSRHRNISFEQRIESNLKNLQKILL